MNAAERSAIRAKFDALPVLITRKHIAAITGRAVVTLKLWQAQGRMPQPDRKIGREVCWVNWRIINWIIETKELGREPIA